MRKLGELRTATMLGKIALVGIQEIGQHLIDLNDIARLHPPTKSLWHAATCKITPKMLDETDMEEIGHCLDLIQAAKVFVVVCSALGFQKLGKAHRVHLHELDLSHRKSAGLTGQANAQQRPCACDVILGGLVTEVFKGADCRRTILDLINNKQRLAGIDRLSKCQGKV